MEIQILIIEDDHILAENLKENLLELNYSNINIVSNYREAATFFQKCNPDLCLVDIHLEGSKKSGIEIVRAQKLGNKIPFIYLTAHDDNHIRKLAKETNPSAYLIKPASKKQLDVAIDFALSQFANKMKGKNSSEIDGKEHLLLPGPNYYFIKNGARYEKISIENIVFLEAEGSYCNIYIDGSSYTVSANLKSILNQLSEREIIRCHRSYAINIHYVHAFDEGCVYMKSGEKIYPVSMGQSYKRKVMNFFPRLKAD